jgi:IS5 family transposase
MAGLLLLKQLENLSDERVVLQFKRNPYYQYFAMTLCQLIKAIDDFNGKFGIGGISDIFFLYGGVSQYARLLGLFAMQDNTHFKNKILSLPKTITLLLAWSVMIKTSTILKP